MTRHIRIVILLWMVLVVANSASACQWDGGTTNIIPGVVELRRGCCDNSGQLLLVVGPIRIELHGPAGLALVGGSALAAIVLITSCSPARKQEKSNC